MGESGVTLGNCYNVSKLAKVSADVRKKIIGSDTLSVISSADDTPSPRAQNHSESAIRTQPDTNLVEMLQSIPTQSHDINKSVRIEEPTHEHRKEAIPVQPIQIQTVESPFLPTVQYEPKQSKIVYTPPSKKRVRAISNPKERIEKRRRVVEERQKGESLSSYYRRIGINE